MANLVRNISFSQLTSILAQVQVPISAAATNIYQGAMVALLLSTGMAVRAGTAGTGRVQGVAVANASPPTVDGGTSVNLNCGLFRFPLHASHTPTQVNVGGLVYASDDNTLSNLESDGPIAGTLVGFEATTGWGFVWISPVGMSATSVYNGPQAASGITAGTTRTQAGATALTADYSRIDTSTAPAAGTILGDGVLLPASTAGLSVAVVNNTAYMVQMYGNGSDTINGVAGVTGVALPPGDVAFLVCAVAGAWYFEAGLGSSGQLSAQIAGDTITAAGTSQATGTQLAAQMNNITTVAAGTGVNLPASAPGVSVVVQNNGANPLQVYPKIGATDTVNGAAATVGVLLHPGSVATFNCTTAGAWSVESTSPVQAALNSVTSADSNIVLTAAQVSGAVAAVDTQLAGGVAYTAGRNLQLPTVASLIAVLHSPTIGTSYRLRITNAQGGAFAATVVTNTGWTLTGTMTIAQNTWREFVVTFTSLTAATIKSVAVGTYS